MMMMKIIREILMIPTLILKTILMNPMMMTKMKKKTRAKRLLKNEQGQSMLVSREKICNVTLTIVWYNIPNEVFLVPSNG